MAGAMDTRGRYVKSIGVEERSTAPSLSLENVLMNAIAQKWSANMCMK